MNDRTAREERGRPARVRPRLPSAQRERLLAELRACARGAGGEVSARERASKLGASYLRLDDAGRHEFLRLIAMEFGPDPAAVAEAHRRFQEAVGTPGQGDAEMDLRAVLRSSRIRILTQFNALPQGVKFLVDLRSDLLRYLKDDPDLAVLDRELQARLSAWFDVGFLELHRITWNSPAFLLEKLIEYEAVHEIRSWADLRNRLEADRRCYAFFHPRMPTEPLIFVEVALTRKLADNIQALLDETAPVLDATKADTAIFYSISNTQKGLRGISFGSFLLKRVIEDLKRGLPRLDTFATLSPLPDLRLWAEATPGVIEDSATAEELGKIAAAAGKPLDGAGLKALLAAPEWTAERRLAAALREPLLRLAARYLLEAKLEGRPADPVARFHLGNGARLERLNWMADLSPKGLRRAWGLMVNYLYDPDAMEGNVERYGAEGDIAASYAVRRFLRRPKP
ncbi:MAG TPA: malonyl-CoA decarboxylase [Burkholderiales bacterium]|nr:malonyl-CoA decarboxylase [Burkholderiales bacterium]